jgi:uncharacterized membrane protein
VLPLHPVVVHFPIVLAVLLPISAAWALWAIRKGTTFRRAWTVPAAIALALTVSALVAVKTGEVQDERVERVVPEQPLESHEEAAETFLTLSAGLALLVAAGLVRGRVGVVARALGTTGAVALVALAAYVGHSGGKLVYEYGAGSAYTGAEARASGSSVSGDAARVSAKVPRRDADEDDDR